MAKPKAPYRIVWRPIAEADLDNIVDYIAQDNPIKAEESAQEGRACQPSCASWSHIGTTSFFIACWKRRAPLKF